MERDWDRHDYRTVRDLYAESPGEVKEIRARCRTYLAAHADGAFRGPVGELLAFCDKVRELTAGEPRLTPSEACGRHLPPAAEDSGQ